MKLTKYDTIYFINSKVLFHPQPIQSSILSTSFEFAYNMAFGEGHHRNHRTGGTEQRSALDIFKNTLQGKIAEGIAFKVLASHGIKCEPVDYSIHGEGVWDDSDLEYKGKRISVKSSAYFSNLLLLETNDWNLDGMWYGTKRKFYYRWKDKMQSMLDFMWSEDKSQHFDEFVKRTRIQDKYRDENFDELYPVISNYIRKNYQ